MEAVSGYLNQLKESLLSAKHHIAHMMVFMWSAYSKPCPSSACEMLTLILLCVLITMTITTMLFLWMVFSLTYDFFFAGAIVGVSACVMMVLLILVHPVRCMVTVTVPSLGTKQGRKIILSTALLYAITSCVPNVTQNVDRSIHMLKCSTGNITHSMLQSINVPRQAFKDIQNMEALSFLKMYTELESNANVNEMEKELSKVSKNVKEELAQLHGSIKQISKILKKLIAGLFVLLMIGSSVAYVSGYLTHIKYDNVYRSHQLMESLQRESGDITLPKCYQKKLVKTSGVRMSTQELTRGLWGMLGLLIYGLMCGLLLGLDYFVYKSLQWLLVWTSDIPDIHAAVDIELKVTGTYFYLVEHNHVRRRSYPFTVTMLPLGCVHPLSAPDHSTLISICVFLAIGFFMVLGEVFARRLRRKVCASFYHSREEQRTQYLLLKILQKRKKQEERDD